MDIEERKINKYFFGVEKTCKSDGLDGKTSWYRDNAWLVVYGERIYEYNISRKNK